MKNLWIKWLAFLQHWSKPQKWIEGAMVTPLLVMRNEKAVRQQVKQLAKSTNYNSVFSLVDLQAGRDYIAPGRTRTALTKIAERNLRIILESGLTPIVISRNDWAQRNKQASIPSLGNAPALADQAAFYSDAMFKQECKFLDSIRPYWPWIHLQISIEPYREESAGFAVNLAEWLRIEGFKNRIIVNPYDRAIQAHYSVGPALSHYATELARSWHTDRPSPDAIHNTDGDVRINAANAPVFLARIRDWGRQYSFWSKELANSANELPEGYL